ncbi:BAR domain [Musa troglodytarum]|uniref:BAR domain n=1 Tax=Musa troglodytarum TaxID=320322 RepID=A0A9E7GEE0_9LILI|nr:BAR domain [Musa troglodytarum]
MKSSLRRLRGFAFHKDEQKQKREKGLVAHQDELLKASQDIHDIRNCYDGLLSAAAAIENSAYEFSEALKELGTCLLEKTALDDDEESGKLLLMLGKAQLELQKLVNTYRVHVVQTITTPSESLLKELQTVEEMKRQCDDKRDVYMLAAQNGKGRLKNAKGDTFSLQQLQAAKEDYEEEATLFLFRLKSLKQGQSRSILTQAARHNASQLNFFRKGVKSLEVVEHIKIVAEQQHIDYQLNGLEDNQLEGYEVDDSVENGDDGELSFNYQQHDQHRDVSYFSRNSMEDDVDRCESDSSPFNKDVRAVSLSAPLFSDRNPKSSETTSQMQPLSTERFYTYTLPTPVDVKSSTSTGPTNSISASGVENKGVCPTQLWHSSPLQPNFLGNNYRDVELPSPTGLPIKQSVSKENKTVGSPIRMPSACTEGGMSQLITSNTSDSKKIGRQVFSGPLTSKPLPSKPASFTSNSMSSVEHLPGVPAKPTSTPTPKLSVPPVTSPRINELHELPRPPIGCRKQLGSFNLNGHSAPLVPRGQGVNATIKQVPISSCIATPLPEPPGVMVRSFSIPSNGRKSNSTDVKSLDHPNSQRTTTDASATHTLMNIG